MAKTILIVDDMAPVRRVLRKICEEQDYEVVAEAANGTEALAHFQRLKPTLVLMDLVMPELSGLDAARQMILFDKRARIVMLSGLHQENLIAEAIAAGVRDYLVKPFRTDDLLRSLSRVLFEDEHVASRHQRA
jgi:two-component system, chemotaxis family, chemotaxis protein CheY